MKDLPVACSVASERRVTKVYPPSPAAVPRQQVKTPLRWSDAESTTAAEVRRQRPMLVASEVAASPGVDTVPTVAFDRLRRSLQQAICASLNFDFFIAILRSPAQS